MLVRIWTCARKWLTWCVALLNHDLLENNVFCGQSLAKNYHTKCLAPQWLSSYENTLTEMEKQIFYTKLVEDEIKNAMELAVKCLGIISHFVESEQSILPSDE